MPVIVIAAAHVHLVVQGPGANSRDFSFSAQDMEISVVLMPEVTDSDVGGLLPQRSAHAPVALLIRMTTPHPPSFSRLYT